MDDTTFTGCPICHQHFEHPDRPQLFSYTFVAKYDWKIDSYQPNDNLSTIWLTSAPSKDRSNSDDSTPSANGTNLFSRQTAIWIGIRQSRSTSHSPTRYRDTCRSSPMVTSFQNEGNSFAYTLMRRSSSPVGFLVVLSNVWMRSEK